MKNLIKLAEEGKKFPLEYPSDNKEREFSHANEISSEGHRISVVQDFENYLKTETNLAEHEIKILSEKDNSSFISHEVPSNIYNIRDLSSALCWICRVPSFPGSFGGRLAKLQDK